METSGPIPSPPLPGGTRKALVIATSVYDGGYSELAGSKLDGRLMAELLADPEICGFDVELLENPAHGEVRMAVNQIFNDREPGDVVLVYFSGHGEKDKIGRLYLMARDTRAAMLPSTGVLAPFILDVADQSATRKQIFILDTCYSGAATTVRSASLADFGLDIESEENFSRGRYLLTASRASQYSIEDRQDGGAFTKALIEGVRSGQADVFNRGLITVQEAYNYAYLTVTQQMGQRQTPMLDIKGAEGPPLVFARNPVGVRTDADDMRQLAETVRGPHPRAQLAAMDKLMSLMDDENLAVAAVARQALYRVAIAPDHPLASSAQQILGLAQPATLPQPATQSVPTEISFSDDGLSFSDEELAGMRFDSQGIPLGPRRVLPLEDEPSNFVARYLYPTERYRGEWRRHWFDALLMAAISGLASGLAFQRPSLESLRLPQMWHVPTPSIVQWLLIGFALLAGRRALSWPIWRMVLTNKRVMIMRGVLWRRVDQIPLQATVSSSQLFLGRILNYGTLAFRVGEWRSHRLRRMPSINELWLRIAEEQHEPAAVEARLGREPEEEY